MTREKMWNNLRGKNQNWNWRIKNWSIILRYNILIYESFYIFIAIYTKRIRECIAMSIKNRQSLKGLFPSEKTLL